MKSKRLLLIFFACYFMAMNSFAADKKGQFGVRGAGLSTCAVYNHERKARSTVYLVIASWVDGYITGANQYEPDTYDTLSFETTELLANIISTHCKKYPGDTIFAVINTILDKLHADRIVKQSKKVTVSVDGRTISLYKVVVERTQKRLSELGFYKGKFDGRYDQMTMNAMKKFQKSISFKPTGFPDQATLWNLLNASF
jgi:hypothetical protein